MIAVTGFDDREMINRALVYRYILRYEPPNLLSLRVFSNLQIPNDGQISLGPLKPGPLGGRS